MSTEQKDDSRETSAEASSVDEIDRQLFQAFRDIELSYASGSVSHDRLRADYRAIADRFVPLYEDAGAPDLAREVERSVAWSVFSLLFDEGCTAQVCETAFAEVLTLGFGSLQQEAQAIIAFCGYCARHGAGADMLERYLEPLMRTLDQSGDPSWTFRQICEDILASAERSPSGSP